MGTGESFAYDERGDGLNLTVTRIYAGGERDLVDLELVSGEVVESTGSSAPDDSGQGLPVVVEGDSSLANWGLVALLVLLLAAWVCFGSRPGEGEVQPLRSQELMDIAEDEGWRQLLSPYLAGDRIYAIRIRIKVGEKKMPPLPGLRRITLRPGRGWVEVNLCTLTDDESSLRPYSSMGVKMVVSVKYPSKV
jgi:hypothetical protein